MNINQIKEWAGENFKEIVAARRHFHTYPELGEKEFETQRYIMGYLKALGIECREIASTGVMAWVNGRPGKRVVAVRGDMDALPIQEESSAPYCSKNDGVMHACGHDAHTAITLGCAKYFKEHEGEFAGIVKFFFQPAEETVGGAKRMVAEGCMKNPDVDYVIGLHVMPMLDYNQAEVRYGARNASTDNVELIVKGKGCHGAYPEMGADAIVMAAHIIAALQTVVSRNVSPVDSAVLTFGKIEGGTAGNVICDNVKIKGTIRAAKEETRKMLKKQIQNISQAVAGAMGGCCDVNINDGYPLVYNNSEVLDVIAANAAALFGQEQVFNKGECSMGGEDFSFFCNDAKGAFYNLGCRIKGKENNMAHTKWFDIDERCLETGLTLQIMNILSLLRK